MGTASNVGGFTKVFRSALALDTNVYGDGDTLADILEVTGAVRSPGGTGILQCLTVLDEDDQGAAFDLYLFDQTVDVGTKNSPWAVSDALMRNCLGVVQIAATDYLDLGGNRLAMKNGLGIPITCLGTSLLLGTRSRGTGTYTASGLRVVVGILQD